MSWVRINKLCKHIDSSQRTVRNYMDLGLPYSRLPNGSLLFELEAIDEWLRDHSADQQNDTAVADELLQGLS